MMVHIKKRRCYFQDEDGLEIKYCYASSQEEADRILADRIKAGEDLEGLKAVYRDRPKTSSEKSRKTLLTKKKADQVMIQRHTHNLDAPDVNEYIDNVNIARGIK